jgi:hypothetical protein
MAQITSEQHRERHVELHKALDELLADWIRHTDNRPSQATVLDLMKWSHQQTIKPDEAPTDG